MNDLDMSRPGSELFPEASKASYNSYQDVNVDQVVEDPLNMGVKSTSDAADQGMSDKEFNFRALREETAKLKQEREYWKGQAEAYSRQPVTPSNTPEQKDPYQSLDFSDSSDVQKAFNTLREENQSLKYEIKDAFKALEVKTQHSDWNNMVTQHVPELTSKNPIFAEMIQKVSNPYEAAYLLAQLNAKGQPEANKPPPIHGNAQRALDNAQKPQSLASVGGSSTLGNADYYANMSDEDFMRIAARNLANI